MISEHSPTTATTIYRPRVRSNAVLYAFALMWVAAPLLMLYGILSATPKTPRLPAPDPVKLWLPILLCFAFSILMALVSLAGARRSTRSQIACHFKSITYCLPPSTFWRNPLGMQTGEIDYASIRGVEIRSERLRAKSFRMTYRSVFLVRDGAPRETFARSNVDDHKWIENFARDAAQRAKVELVDRGLIDATYHGMNKPW